MLRSLNRLFYVGVVMPASAGLPQALTHTGAAGFRAAVKPANRLGPCLLAGTSCSVRTHRRRRVDARFRGHDNREQPAAAQEPAPAKAGAA